MRALLVVAAVGAGALSLAPAAAADISCVTSRYSGMSFTTCRYVDPWQPATTTTCWDRLDYCYTREG